jgi:hypothetical protein
MSAGEVGPGGVFVAEGILNGLSRSQTRVRSRDRRAIVARSRRGEQPVQVTAEQPAGYCTTPLTAHQPTPTPRRKAGGHGQGSVRVRVRGQVEPGQGEVNSCFRRR